MILGFSSGTLHRTHDALSPDTFDVFRKLGCNAIEVMFHNAVDVDKFLQIQKSDLDGFEYVSLHAPMYMGKEQDAEYRRALLAIVEKQKEINFQCVVLHPDMFETLDMLKEFDLPYAIENMDNRKSRYKNVEDLKQLFAEFDTKFVLDLNHVYVNDQSMNLTTEFIREFGDRLTEIHLSGFEALHEPLFITKQTEILDALPDKSLPIILESGGNPPEYLEKEYGYVKEYLQNH